MKEDVLPAGGHRQRTTHELWLAMRTAYERHRETSAKLRILSGRVRQDPNSCGTALLLDAAAEQRWKAFEEYVEARLQFSEFLLSADKEEAREERPDPKGVPIATFWRGLPVRRRLLPAVAVALVLPALAVVKIAGERKAPRGSDLARHAEPILNRNTEQSVPVAVRSVAADATPLPPHTPQEQPSRPISQPKHPREAVENPRADLATPVRSRKVVASRGGARQYYRFALTRSSRSEQIGPFRLSLQKTDRDHRYIDLSVTARNFNLKRTHLQIHEPVWLDVKETPRPAVLVIERIDSSQVWGFLSVSNGQKSRLKSRTKAAHS